MNTVYTESISDLRKQVERLTEERWKRLLAQSQEMLADWAREALAEDEAGMTEPLSSPGDSEERHNHLFLDRFT